MIGPGSDKNGPVYVSEMGEGGGGGILHLRKRNQIAPYRLHAPWALVVFFGFLSRLPQRGTIYDE